MHDLAILLYVVAVGFVAAGILSSFVQLVTGQPLRFGIEGRTLLASIGGVCLRVFAGPVILMGNALRAAKVKAHPPGWLWLSGLIASAWSLLLGLFVLDLVLKL